MVTREKEESHPWGSQVLQGDPRLIPRGSSACCTKISGTAGEGGGREGGRDRGREEWREEGRKEASGETRMM